MQRADLFNILFYAPREAEVPAEFVEADAHIIQGATEMVKLNRMGTGRHGVEGTVAYKVSSCVVPFLAATRKLTRVWSISQLGEF